MNLYFHGASSEVDAHTNCQCTMYRQEIKLQLAAKFDLARSSLETRTPHTMEPFSSQSFRLPSTNCATESWTKASSEWRSLQNENDISISDLEGIGVYLALAIMFEWACVRHWLSYLNGCERGTDYYVSYLMIFLRGWNTDTLWTTVHRQQVTFQLTMYFDLAR